MNLSRIASLCVPLLAGAAAIHCDPADEPQPVAPQNATGDAPPPNEPPAPPSDGARAATEGENMYSSGEVAIGAEADGYDDDDPAALTDFHATLDTQGTWADDPTYGTVWVPSPTVVGADFRPYVTAGHWAYDDDWVWVSDYEWGWAPFHYGRWVSIEGRGWAWIPGRGYRGAWVTWGVDDGYSYLGWAPMGPNFIWFGGVARPFPGYAAPRWVYCPRGDVFSASMRTRVVSGAAAGPIAVRVRPYVSASPGVATGGPSPQRMGFQSAQIPHSGGAPSVARAQQFAHPSTASALGARAPTRAAAISPVAQSGHSPHPTENGAATSGAGRAPSAASMPAAGHVPSAGARPPTNAGRIAPVAPARGGGRGSSRGGGGGGGHHH